MKQHTHETFADFFVTLPNIYLSSNYIIYESNIYHYIMLISSI